MKRVIDALPVTCNVRVRAIDKRTDKIVEERVTHNVLTNVGRTWLRNIVGAASYAAVDPVTGWVEGSGNALTSERVRYQMFGVGGALSAAPYFNTQEELTTATELEDWVNYDASNYMVEVLPQTAANSAFPDDYSIRFIGEIPESAISYAGNTSGGSAQVVGTSVPVSEAGLYLSGADKTKDPQDSANNTRMVAYNIFDPITVTPNIVLRVEWEFRF